MVQFHSGSFFTAHNLMVKYTAHNGCYTGSNPVGLKNIDNKTLNTFKEYLDI
jgi:hypothetical protein